MPRDCLFCGLKAGNKEHLFASWILGKREWGPMRRAIGKLPVKIAGGDVTVGTVCMACNNGWMSTLESQNMALIGALMEGVSVPLDTSQQATLSAWSLKTAMVLDTVNNRGRTAFYEKTECENLRLSSTIPSMTNIWVGRCSVQGLMGNGTDFWTFLADKTKIGRGCATTILIGHLAIQVATIHPFGGPSAGHKIGLRLDQNPARYETWGESTAHDALFAEESEYTRANDVVYPSGQLVVLAKAMAKGKTLTFQFTPFSGSPQVATFDLRGIESHIGKVADACGWTMD